MAKRSGLVGSDVDAELYNYFNGGYAAELGLKSSTGSQLERLMYKLGPSAVRTPDGYNDHVRFDITGSPAGYVEATKVAMAMHKVAEARGTAMVAALHGYYLRRPHGAYEGLHDYAEFAGVALGVPKTRGLVDQHCARELARELAENAGAIARSRRLRIERHGMLMGRLRTLAATKPAEHHFVEGGTGQRACRDCGAKKAGRQSCWSLEKRRILAELPLAQRKLVVAADKKPPEAHPDTEAAIRAKWAQRGEGVAMLVLRMLAKAARGPKDGPERQAARKAQADILDDAKAAWRAARAAYAEARKQVDRDIRAAKGARRGRTEVDAAFLASLQYYPADAD